jgi:hypothetical protein
VSEHLTPQPGKGKKPREEVEDLDDVVAEDEDEEEEEERPRKRKKAKPSLVMTLVPTVLALAAFALMAFSPLFTWFFVKAEASFKGSSDTASAAHYVDGRGYGTAKVEGKWPGDKDPSPDRLSSDGRPEGLAISIVSGVLAVVTLAACVLVLLNVSNPGLANAVKGVLAVAMAGAVLMLVWFVGWVVKIVMLSRKINEEVAKDSEIVSSFTGQISYTTMPGTGLFIALGCSVLAALCLSMALTNVSKRAWAYVAQGGGLLVGLLLVAALVRPWNADEVYSALKSEGIVIRR